MVIRLVLYGVLLFSILCFPWWITVSLGVALVIFVKHFYEIVGWGIFFDLLYGTMAFHVFGFNFFFTLGALVLFFTAEHIKSKTIFD